MTSAALLSPSPTCGLCWHEVLEHRDYLVRFARRKLHDPALAEDVVHDVFEVVLGGRARFGGRSALRSWLVGILKNKLVDLIRDRVRYSALDSDEDESGESNNQQVCGAPRPDDLAEQRERLALVMARIQQLPDGLREVMEWRVLNDEPTDVVCERLGISQDSLFVRLHRARKRLDA
ncbi:sigma-70 family RNA polymerase sigma factor [Hydrogenophaga sp.]|uniref:RNA polymerase sigma factor n=1 Tax=Hydrogenophaga sp. TaxID=1904254 RepID=UPI0025BC6852|nr:sigma-70 family RNA polymerase sigma factor [Hydrogenophaga sp.]